MADAADLGLEQYDDGLDPDSAQEDLGDFTINWVDAEDRFDPAIIHAKLVIHGKDGDIPFEVDEIKTEPPDIVELIQDVGSSDGNVAIFDAKLTDRVLQSADFLDKVARPVKVTITVKSSSPTMSLITTAPESIKQTCRVGVKPPRPRIQWEDADNLGVRNPQFEVDADGEDTMELHVWLERWDPRQKRMAADPTVEFSHMTNERFDPEVFGPAPDSQPWVVAQPGSGDTRFCSLWKSMMALPNPERRETLPWDGMIRVRAWKKGDILGRSVNRVRLRPGATPLAQAFVPVVLGPAKAVAKLVSPEEPICADDQPHDVVLQFVSARSGRPITQARVSWELTTGPRYPGGTLDPKAATIAKGDEGKVKLTYRPPKLIYDPNASYDQDIRCFVGEGDARKDAGGVSVFVSPEVKLELGAKKCGLAFEPAFPLTIPCDEAPDRIVAHVGFESRQPGFPDKYDVFDAAPEVNALAESGSCKIQLDVRTDSTGIYTLSLPGLAPGLAKFNEDSPRRKRTLRPFQDEKAGDLNDECIKLVEKYRDRLNDAFAVLNRLIPAAMLNDLAKQPQVMAKHLCIKEEADCVKCKEGLRIEEATIAVTKLVDALADELLSLGLRALGEFLKALFDLLNEWLKLGERILKLLGLLAGKITPGWVYRVLSSMLHGALNILEYAAPALAMELRLTLIAIESGQVPADQGLKALWDQAANKLSEALEGSVKKIADLAVDAIEGAADAGLIKPPIAAARKKAIKAIEDFIVNLIKTGGLGAEQFAKETLRDTLGLARMSDAATGAIGGTIKNIEGFAYEGLEGTAQRYLADLPNLLNMLRSREQWRADVTQVWGAVSAIADFVMTLSTGMAIIGLVLAPETMGASLAITLGALATKEAARAVFGRVKALIGVGVSLYTAFLLIPAYEELLKYYELRTLAMTGNDEWAFAR